VLLLEESEFVVANRALAHHQRAKTSHYVHLYCFTLPYNILPARKRTNCTNDMPVRQIFVLVRQAVLLGEVPEFAVVKETTAVAQQEGERDQRERERAAVLTVEPRRAILHNSNYNAHQNKQYY